jgi:hypothetical protein
VSEVEVPGKTGTKKWVGIGAAVVAAALAAGGLIWSLSSGEETAPVAKVFGPQGFGKLSLGMTSEAALATGELAPAPTSQLDGCADYSFTGGPVPDPARMAAEAEAEKKAVDAKRVSAEVNAKADEPLPANAGAKEYAESAARFADGANAIATSAEAAEAVTVKRDARTAAFGASGGASFGKRGLVSLAAPVGVKTAEGIGRESTVDELKAAYVARGLVEDNGNFTVPVAEKPGWVYRFTAVGGKVTSLVVISELGCAA